MSIIPIVTYDDEVLRKKAVAVEGNSDDFQTFIDDMFETMYQAPGIGLAASQVNVHKQLMVIDVSEEGTEPLVLINPVIEVLDETHFEFEEGCLSVPGFQEMVSRPKHIRVNALDRNGEAFTLAPEGLLALCIQHEMDHLQGNLFVDHISNMKRRRIRKKLEKQQKLSANT